MPIYSPPSCTETGSIWAAAATDTVGTIPMWLAAVGELSAGVAHEVNNPNGVVLSRVGYLLQIADFDVDSITPFKLAQNRRFDQNQRFSQIRYGSQVDLIVPLSDRYELTPLLEPTMRNVGQTATSRMSATWSATRSGESSRRKSTCREILTCDKCFLCKGSS